MLYLNRSKNLYMFFINGFCLTLYFAGVPLRNKQAATAVLAAASSAAVCRGKLHTERHVSARHRRRGHCRREDGKLHRSAKHSQYNQFKR